MTIGQTAKYVRSKNAGPFKITIDIFCADDASFDKFQSSSNCTPHSFAKIFNVNAENIRLFFVKDLRVIKISFPRPGIQGHKYERDMHCGQQYVRILDIEL